MNRDPRFRDLDYLIARESFARQHGRRGPGAPRIHVNGKLSPAERRRAYLAELGRIDQLHAEGLHNTGER